MAPRAPIHVVSGAGAAPAFGSEAPPTRRTARSGGADPGFTRLNLYRWSYSVIEAANATHLFFAQIDNSNSSAIDAWTVVQPAHGKFPTGA